jgi:hypothetical protein
MNLKSFINQSSKKHILCFFSIFLLLSSFVKADIHDDLGYNLLTESLSNNQTFGSSIRVTQVEAGDNYFPDISNSEFSSKNFLNLNQTPNFNVSNHATNVGLIFYGSQTSLSPAVSDIDIIGSNDFLSNQLDFVSYPSSNPEVGSSRVVNHSWVGDYVYLIDEENRLIDTTNMLKHIDWLIANDDVIHVVGVSNNLNTDVPLLSSAYNVISVGKTNATHDYETSILEDAYFDQRPVIHLVTPENYTSRSTAYVSSAVSTLIDLGNQNQGWSSGSFINRNGDDVFNSQRVEVMKSLLMAGASRLTFNSSNFGQIRDYRSSNYKTDNGLDLRYGAGQLDIYSSYLILSAGEKPSLEDGGTSNIGFNGFDYDPSFGGSFGSNNTGTYDLGVIPSDGFLQASLSWNLRVDGPTGSGPFSQFDTNSSLQNLSLTLVDITSGIENEIQISDSMIDNTQNIRDILQSGNHYQLKVKSLSGTFRIDYGLAWHFKDFTDFDGDGCHDHLDSDPEDPNITHLTNCSVDVPMLENKALYILIIIMLLLAYSNIHSKKIF